MPPRKTEPPVEIELTCDVQSDFAVETVRGAFDLPDEPASFRLRLDGMDAVLPGGEPWQIGLITGPSGSGKSTLARQFFALDDTPEDSWPADRAVISAFGEDFSVRDVLCPMLTAVGFSSPPAWLRPHRTLSVGEQARAGLARALLCPDTHGRVVVDEFTSTVDRTVAKVMAMAVAKAVRRQRGPARQFLAVSCHSDIRDWLQPDWTLDLTAPVGHDAGVALHRPQWARGSLPRPGIRLQVRKTTSRDWPLFARHHYLTGEINRASSCYLASVGLGEDPPRPAGFLSLISAMGRQAVKRVHRLVVLPDYQGCGVGMAFLEGVCSLYATGQNPAGRPQQVTITTGHPALYRALRQRPAWRLVSVRDGSAKPQRGPLANLRRRKHAVRSARGRPTCSFAYRPEASP